MILVSLWEGLGLGLVAAMPPGPDTFLIIRVASAEGQRAGFRCVAGSAVALCIHSLVSLFVIEEVASHMPKALLVVQFVGGIYMLWFGLASFGKARQPVSDMAPDTAAMGDGLGTLWRGMFTNLLNPQALAFFMFLVAPFLARASGLTEAVVLVMGVDVAIVAWFLTLAAAAASLGGLLRRRYRLVEFIFGTLFVAFGIGCLIVSMKPLF